MDRFQPPRNAVPRSSCLLFLAAASLGLGCVDLTPPWTRALTHDSGPATTGGTGAGGEASTGGSAGTASNGTIVSPVNGSGGLAQDRAQTTTSGVGGTRGGEGGASVSTSGTGGSGSGGSGSGGAPMSTTGTGGQGSGGSQSGGAPAYTTGTGGQGSGGSGSGGAPAYTTGTGGRRSGGSGSGGSGSGGVGTGGSATGTVVTFLSGFGQGLMTGEGWVSLGSADSISSPTCGPSQTAITSATPCTGPKNWSHPTALCATGQVPALHNPPTQSDYDTNWGIQIGVDENPPSSAIGQAFRTITFEVSGSPASGLRAELHRQGDPAPTVYCATLVSGVPIQFTAFNTSCWNGGGTPFKATDVALIDKVIIHVPPASTAITLQDLCLKRIVFQL